VYPTAEPSHKPTPRPTDEPTHPPTVAATHEPTVHEKDYIAQVATVGNTPMVSYNLVRAGGESSCISIAASGTLSSVNVMFYFDAFWDTEALPSDMYLTVNATSGDNTACYQWGGYDINV